MFCFSCGKQIRDDAAFCQYCGISQRTDNNLDALTKTDNTGELNRDALKLYLGNVLSLECIKTNYERRIADTGRKVYHLGTVYHEWWYVLQSDDRVVHLMYDGQNYYISCKERKGQPITKRWSDCDCVWKCIDLSVYGQSDIWEECLGRRYGFFERRRVAEEMREGFLRAYSQFSSEAPAMYSNMMREISDLNQLKRGLENELKPLEDLLEKTYALNIIPDQFRHSLYAIYYLHNFISTSQESLTTALLHFDLGEIKQKLDKIIDQQEEIIIQQAINNAQNQQLLRQNQQQLEYLSSIESNTSQAAQYAQIAANNAEACAWIGMANYIEMKCK